MSLCLCVSVSFPLSLFPPSFVRMHGESSLGGKNSYQNLILLAPWSGTSSPQNSGNKFLLFIPLSLLYYFMAFLADKYKIIYFGNLQKKMNERKLKKLMHFLGILEILQNWSVLRIPHLMSWWLLWPREYVIWNLANAAFLLKGQYSPVTYSRFHLGAWQAIVHGVTRVGNDLATKPPLQYLQTHWTLFWNA